MNLIYPVVHSASFTMGEDGRPRVQRRTTTTHPFQQHGHPRFQRRRQTESGEASTSGMLGVLLQILPLLILFLLSLVSQSQNSSNRGDPSFSFQKNRHYQTPRETYRRNIRFFVEPNEFQGAFQTADSSRRRNFEDRIEATFIRQHQDSCAQERKTKQYKVRNAKWFGTQEAVEEAERHPTPSCDMLRQLGVK